jgi:hypothetical protein
VSGEGSGGASGGVGFTGLLTVLFIALKLTHVIDWPWWWVLSPVWISLLATLVVLLVVALVAIFKR